MSGPLVLDFPPEKLAVLAELARARGYGVEELLAEWLEERAVTDFARVEQVQHQVGELLGELSASYLELP